MSRIEQRMSSVTCYLVECALSKCLENWITKFSNEYPLFRVYESAMWLNQTVTSKQFWRNHTFMVIGVNKVSLWNSPWCGKYLNSQWILIYVEWTLCILNPWMRMEWIFRLLSKTSFKRVTKVIDVHSNQHQTNN